MTASGDSSPKRKVWQVVEVSSATWRPYKPGSRDLIQIISGGPALHCNPPSSPLSHTDTHTHSQQTFHAALASPQTSALAKTGTRETRALRVGRRTGEICLGSRAAHLLSKSLSGSDNHRSVYTRNATLITSCLARRCRGAWDWLKCSGSRGPRFRPNEGQIEESDRIREQFHRHSVSLCVFPGKDVATNVEVYWPDGRSVARPLEPSDINSVLEIRYPQDEDEVTPTAEIEVHCCTVAQRGTSWNIGIWQCQTSPVLLWHFKDVTPLSRSLFLRLDSSVLARLWIFQ